ncbi:hypothetical protein GCM10008955_11310 [Deinococcus malanensis]|uniref:Uncharacterized protein n=1 Tax=Deinococcus malanensis TaxID=1706855 RepID=A0ABQ2ET81_9DEIO|nr:hypothetical protein GCM10008955_11310 [Deinococcus malanensis]
MDNFRLPSSAPDSSPPPILAAQTPQAGPVEKQKLQRSPGGRAALPALKRIRGGLRLEPGIAVTTPQLMLWREIV